MEVNNSNYRSCRTSALESAKRCPFATQKIYRDKAKGFISPTASRGSAIHDALENYGNHCLKHRFATDLEYWDSIIYKYAAKVPAEVYGETLNILVDVKEYINFGILLDAHEAHIEERFYINERLEIINPGDNAFFSSAIDYYFIEHGGKKAQVFDYKTARKIFSKTVLSHKLQNKYYPLLIFIKYPEVEEIDFFFEFARYGVMSEPTSYTREEDFDCLCKMLIADCNEYYEIVNDLNDREARPSGFCSLCECIGVCPSVNNALDQTVIITNAESALQAARNYKALQLKTKQVKESLDIYLEQHPNIEMSPIEGFGIQKTSKESVQDVYHLVEDLKEAKVAPGKIFDVLKITKAAFLKLIKSTNIPKEKYLVAKESTKIGFYDLESDDEHDEGEE